MRRGGLSGFSFLGLSGPVITPEDVFALCPRETPARARTQVAEMLPFTDEVISFQGFFGGKRRCFHMEEDLSQEVVRRSELFNRYWRPLGVERQLVGALGTAREPVGFVCVSRSASEQPFTSGDLSAFEELRRIIDRTLLATRRLGRGTLDDALEVLARSTPAAWLLFDAVGHLLWLTDEARVWLSVDAARVGTSFALRNTQALQRLRSWVRAEARRSAEGALRCELHDERLVMRRYAGSSGDGPLFLVGFADSPTTRGDSTEAQVRAAELAGRYGLTRRQTEVLAQLASGKANKAIAALLGCGESAVELHVTALLAKLERQNRAGLVARFWTS